MLGSFSALSYRLICRRLSLEIASIVVSWELLSILFVFSISQLGCKSGRLIPFLFIALNFVVLWLERRASVLEGFLQKCQVLLF